MSVPVPSRSRFFHVPVQESSGVFSPFPDCYVGEYLSNHDYYVAPVPVSVAPDVLKLPIVFINCDSVPFIDRIMSLNKTFETRSRNTLRRFEGQTVYLAETGKGHPPVVRCTASVGSAVDVRSRSAWDRLRSVTCVPTESKYDWKDDTKVKYLYPLFNVRPVSVPFIPSGIRHGRIWMEVR